MFKSVLFLLFRVLGAVILGGMLFASVCGLFILPSIGWDLVHWDYYAALRSGRTEGFISTFVRGALHVVNFIVLLAAIPMLAALFCSVVGWHGPAAKIWRFFDYLQALGNKKCATG